MGAPNIHMGAPNIHMDAPTIHLVAPNIHLGAPPAATGVRDIPGAPAAVIPRQLLRRVQGRRAGATPLY
eukprot:6042074-Pyramimonas_sp.AAC.1